jgi:photosystem II stability/assembly factor-like uncharacterized protein
MDRTLRTCFLLIGLPLAVPVLSSLGLLGLGCDAKTTQATGCMKDGDCGSGRICDETGRCIAEPKKVNVLISKVGDGDGVITSNPAGLDCGTTCTASFYLGRPVTLTATPGAGSNVAGFSIGCSSTTSTCQFTPTVEEDVQVLVNFGRGGPTISQPVCTASGVCWENPRPQGNRLNDVHLSQPGSDLWAVGDAGMVVRRTGTGFLLSPTGGTQTLRGIGGSSVSLYVVGDGGLILRWGGTAWQSESSGVVSDLYDVWGNDTSAFVVGAGGMILRRVGVSWQQMSSGTTRTLRGIAVLSTTGEAYAVGDGATALRWNGTAWSSVSSAVLNNHDLRSVAATDGNYPVYAVASSGEIYRLPSAAGTWEQVYTTNTIDFGGVTVSALGTFAVGREVGGTVMRTSNGTTWTRDIFGFQSELTSIASTATEVWAVGDAGAMLRYDGSPWTPQSSGRNAPLRAVSAADASNVWAAGASGTLLRYSADTRAWSPVTLPGQPPPTMYGVAAVSASEAYAVGSGGALFKWNGTSWGALSSGTGSDLYAVCAPAPGRAIVVGSSGLVLRVQGSTVTASSGGTASPLRALWCPSASEQWAAGDSGIVVRDTGTGFAPFASQPGTTATIGGIWGTSATSFWLAAGPDLYQYTGGGYTRHTPGVTGLRSVWGGRADDVYAVGDKGTILRWGGGPSWTRIDSSTNQALYGVGGNSLFVWFVGDGGTVLGRSR